MLLLAAIVALAWWLEERGVLEHLEVGRSGAQTPHEVGKPYDRKDWPHWSDADADCQDTRQEVLIAESEVPVRFRDERRCAVASGRWRCPYTGQVITDPHQLDVDHLVPLHEAHRSGGSAWDRARRERYANELSDPVHLVAVERGANRAKGDKAPHQWMPQAPEYRCEYVREWIDVKSRWGLQTSPPEQAYLEQAQATCARGQVPALPHS
ncbi:HNH endonuclease family protein [Paraliomyxa miuraensis]|uniref:HNH endonuclease family protein n=1 Tax=Paraliomyxa miuraensis TaxID=376150 RepID=UPI00225266C1|nr:HNH endonuclease family protein [Paraliomyxa miuraensis]MCX4242355.1 HNH endonuclease family protein [Paraliomyxa miuraensis]